MLSLTRSKAKLTALVAAGVAAFGVGVAIAGASGSPEEVAVEGAEVTHVGNRDIHLTPASNGQTVYSTEANSKAIADEVARNSDNGTVITAEMVAECEAEERDLEADEAVAGDCALILAQRDNGDLDHLKAADR